MDEIIAKMKKSTYKPVAGRMKLAPGKKARSEKKGATEFEMELMDYLVKVFDQSARGWYVFRSPASMSPVDVWVIQQDPEDDIYGSIVRCYQCKTTKDTSPPKIVKKEFDDFLQFTSNLKAKRYWVDRWKKNKGKYIRRIRGIDVDGQFFQYADDFSNIIRREKKPPST